MHPHLALQRNRAGLVQRFLSRHNETPGDCRASRVDDASIAYWGFACAEIDFEDAITGSP